MPYPPPEQFMDPPSIPRFVVESQRRYMQNAEFHHKCKLASYILRADAELRFGRALTQQEINLSIDAAAITLLLTEQET